MTLMEAKALLNEHNIPCVEKEYESEKDFWLHISLFPYEKKAKSCKVNSLIILSNNGKTNIELQFNETDDAYVFHDVWFGEYAYELFDCEEKFLGEEIITIISEAKSGNIRIVVINDLKHRRWCGDEIFDVQDNQDKWFGNKGFEKTVTKILKPKRFLDKLLKTKYQYEIYDWNSYRCIVK